jgi:hypothetical protein
MPRFDGTGPMGQGPMTGRGMGYCAVPLSQPAPAVGINPSAAFPYYSAYGGVPSMGLYGLATPFYPRFGRGFRVGFGRGFGRGRGRGRGGRGRWW